MSILNSILNTTRRGSTPTALDVLKRAQQGNVKPGELTKGSDTAFKAFPEKPDTPFKPFQEQAQPSQDATKKIPTVEELKAEGKKGTEIKREIDAAKDDADKKALEAPKDKKALSIEPPQTKEQALLEQEQNKINDELKQAPKDAKTANPADPLTPKKPKAEDGNPNAVQSGFKPLTPSSPDASKLPKKLGDVDPVAKSALDRITSGATSRGISSTGSPTLNALQKLSNPTLSDASDEKKGKVIDKDQSTVPAPPPERTDRYASHVKKEIDDSEAGLDKEAKDASADWNDANEALNESKSGRQEELKQKNEQELQQAQQEAAKQRLSKAERAKRKENAKSSGKSGRENKEKGKQKAGESREFAKREYKGKAVVVYKAETQFNKTLARQFVETKQKPKECRDSFGIALQKAQDKAGRINYAALGDPSGMSKEARLQNPLNMVNLLQQNQPMLDQIKNTFGQGQNLGKQALNMGNQAKQKADQGNRNIAEGVGTILGGVQQIIEGIQQLANLFTIPMGIANIAMGIMGIVQGAEQCGDGEEEVDESNDELENALGLNRQSEKKGQEGVEAADGMLGATEQIIQLLEEDESQGNESPMSQLLKQLDQKKQQQRQAQQKQGGMPVGVAGATAAASAGGPNITAGTKGANGQNSLLGGLGQQEGEDQDYEEAFLRIAGIFGGGGLKKGFSGGRFGGFGGAAAGGAFSGGFNL